jgi:NAD(P)-dependent dehydrogenase (short-subunit alcohol dehydrogenase family)
MLLTGKTALITGTASGIGAATAELFAQQGAKVFAVDINEKDGEEIVNRIRAASGEAFFHKADIGQMNQVEAMVEASLRRYSRLDIVVSNAAKYAVGTPTEISEADWDRTLAVCLKATWMIARSTLPKMVAQGGGVFIITGSIHAIRGYAGHSAYQASKGGLLALTRAFAADYAPTVRVNTILPGAVVTGRWEGIDENERERLADRCPLKRNGKPEEIAQVALFLASDMSSYMTGSAVVVDGGLSSVIRTE